MELVVLFNSTRGTPTPSPTHLPTPILLTCTYPPNSFSVNWGFPWLGALGLEGLWVSPQAPGLGGLQLSRQAWASKTFGSRAAPVGFRIQKGACGLQPRLWAPQQRLPRTPPMGSRKAPVGARASPVGSRTKHVGSSPCGLQNSASACGLKNSAFGLQNSASGLQKNACGHFGVLAITFQKCRL